MKALIFAAGKGVRMLPLTNDCPKPLLKVGNRSILERILEVLPEEITEILMVVGYKGEMIKAAFGDSFHGRPISYLEQKEALGTGNALMLCAPRIALGEKFLLVYADDLRDKASLERGIKREHAIFVKAMPETGRFGTVEVDSSKRILGLEEASEDPKSNLVVTGAYVLTSKIFDYPPSLEKSGEYYINSMLLGLMKDSEVYAEEADFWLPIGYPEDIGRAEEALRARAEI